MPDLSRMPKHVAFIMDGNGRWATSRGLPRVAGHRAGMKIVHDVIRQSKDWGIKVVTFYAFSTENWKRPQTEVSFLMNLLIEFIDKELDEMDRNGVHLHILGEVSALPVKVRKAIERGLAKTRDNHDIIVNIALNYGGRAEIIRAVKEIAGQVAQGTINPSDIDETMLSEKLYTGNLPDPDLIIRTSGEMRLSNFLLFQCAYAEFAFPETAWPDFTSEAYALVINGFQARNRRYGGI